MEKEAPPPVRLEPLQKSHDRAQFDCGIELLNRYLKELASQELQRRTAAVFVIIHEGDPRILGYYTLSQSSVLLSDLPDGRRKKLPRYPQVPTTLLGRLAVDQSCKGQRYGELLLMNALERAWHASREAASFAMVVDVLDIQPDPLQFYLNYGFESFPNHPRRLFLPLQKVDGIFDAPKTTNKAEAPKKSTSDELIASKPSLEKITELCFGMKLFDKDAGYIGRICELDRAYQTITYLTPSQGTHTMALAAAKDSCRRGFILQDPKDPAVQFRWKNPDDIPATRPGLTFEDGVLLGKQQAAAYAAVVPAPYDWLYQEPEPSPLGDDDFNNGYLSGFAPEFRKRLLAKFPIKTHPPPKIEKTWKNTRWGIDPLDPASVVSFQRGVELGNQQIAWLPELQADGLIQEAIKSQSPVETSQMNIVAFRFGFKSQMEKRFPYRY